jgi:hypothetical protein
MVRWDLSVCGRCEQTCTAAKQKDEGLSNNGGMGALQLKLSYVQGVLLKR